MKKPRTSDQTLESLRIYPYVAWGLITVFAYFVYSITQELRSVTIQLQTQADLIEDQISTLPR